MSPVFSANALAICFTRLLLALLARDCNAPFKSPFFNNALTSLGKRSIASTVTLGSSSKLSMSILPPPARKFTVSVAILADTCAGDISSVRGGLVAVLALPCTFSTASAMVASSCSFLLNFRCALGVSSTTFSAFFLGFLRSGITCTLPLLAFSIFLFLACS